MRRTIITAIAVFTLFATACSMGDASPTSTTRAPTSGTGQPVVNASLASHSLVQFDQCEAFLDYVVEHAIDLVGPYGFDWGGGYRLAGAEVEFFEDISEELSAASDGFEAPVTTVNLSFSTFSTSSIMTLSLPKKNSLSLSSKESDPL